MIHRSRPLLGTFVVVSVSTADRVAAPAAISAAFAEIERVDALMSLHRPDSELVRLNQLAADGPVSVSPDLFRVIAAAQKIAADTDGSFDITIRPLTQLWGFIWKEYRLPTDAELRQVLPAVSHRRVQLDLRHRTVTFTHPGVSLDLGGIAKGYAVDCAIERLRTLGFTNAMVRAGGDLRVLGSPPGAAHWTVQLEDPVRRGHRTAIPLLDAALSTSGNYENFFEVNGRRYSHILDPRTGLPVEGIAACTVLAPTCLESDAWATACFVLGVEPSLGRVGPSMAVRFTLAPAAGRTNWPLRTSALFPRALTK